mmetsp:Transcript_44891/g.148770  ORF Transcript_44891/g.148770 Transcript_44891/m.148770 type:complete len:209 (+) Transcript_44891:296-922(+)
MVSGAAPRACWPTCWMARGLTCRASTVHPAACRRPPARCGTLSACPTAAIRGVIASPAASSAFALPASTTPRMCRCSRRPATHTCPPCCSTPRCCGVDYDAAIPSMPARRSSTAAHLAAAPAALQAAGTATTHSARRGHGASRATPAPTSRMSWPSASTEWRRSGASRDAGARSATTSWCSTLRTAATTGSSASCGRSLSTAGRAEWR